MGQIKDKEKHRKDKDGNPLNDGFGKTDRDTNDYDIDADTIKEQRNKK